MKTIMQDIASLAGVSPGTVSNALNNRKGVGIETKEKILKIAEELGYNRSSKDEPKVIRLIIFKKHGYVVSDTPFFSALIEGIERECRVEGFEMLIYHIGHKEYNAEAMQEIIKQEQIAGVLLLATEMEEVDLEPFESINIPLVILDSYFDNVNFDQVLINNSKGACQAVRHLVKNGHKEIGCLGSSKFIQNFHYRHEGYRKALKEAKLETNKDFEFILEPTLEGAYRDMSNILKNKALKLPTAFFALNDLIAFGAMRAMKESGISIPEQVSIIGFDDLPFCEFINPRLTTVKVSTEYLGKTAVKRLLENIAEQNEVAQKIEIDTKLIERESVNKIK